MKAYPTKTRRVPFDSKFDGQQEYDIKLLILEKIYFPLKDNLFDLKHHANNTISTSIDCIFFVEFN